MRASRGVAAMFAGLVVAAIAASPLRAGAATADAVPAGYRVGEQHDLAGGVTHVRLEREDDPLVVHVARIRASGATQLRPVLSAGDVDGRLERTSEMCQRASCIVAVNADFHHPDSEQPVGGLVMGGVMARSPVESHHQLTFVPSGPVAAGRLQWSGRLMASDLKDVEITDVNRPRVENALVLYTPLYGQATATNDYGAELVMRIVEPAGDVHLGQTSMVEMVELRDNAGSTRIPADGAVLSGHGTGADALRELWKRVESAAAGRRALLRLESATDATDSVGGSPVLVRNGRVWVGDDGSSFVSGRHPRTIVGWTASGDVLLAAIDGRQPGYSGGATLLEAAGLMVDLGAVEALNLDGGGSTTFVAHGSVLNRPSDRVVRRAGVEQIVPVVGRGDTLIGWVERPVSVALAVVPVRPAISARRDPLSPGVNLPSRDAPRELALGLPAGDPGSVPDGRLPALVEIAPAPSSHRGAAVVAALALLAVMIGTVHVERVSAAARGHDGAEVVRTRRRRRPGVRRR